eukprot:15446962-Alexandrium_andersonii.AAC.1
MQQRDPLQHRPSARLLPTSNPFQNTETATNAQQGLVISAPFVVHMVVVSEFWKGTGDEIAVLLSCAGRHRAAKLCWKAT